MTRQGHDGPDGHQATSDLGPCLPLSDKNRLGLPKKTSEREETTLICKNIPESPRLSQLLQEWSQCRLQYCIWLEEEDPPSRQGSQIIAQILLIK